MNRPFGLLAPRLLTLAVSVALAAIHGTASPQSVASRGDATSRADVAAIALARAIADGDTAAVVKTMLDDVVLIQSDRSVVTGSSAVASALLRTRFAAGEYRLLYEITESFGCLTGTVQTAHTLVLFAYE